MTKRDKEEERSLKQKQKKQILVKATQKKKINK